MIWAAIAVCAAGCYTLKVAGLSVPRYVLDHPWTVRIAALIPVGLLGALIAVQVFADGTAVRVDARLAGLGAAVVLLIVRAPFLVVVAGAALTAALLRML